jgi:hypothetical protein
MTVFEVYKAFRRAQALHHARPYQLPKDFEYYFNTKMSSQNRAYLNKAALYFSTKWKNININKFMACGFELFGKNFTYVRFFNIKLLKYYIEKDKNKKRELRGGKREIVTSTKFIRKYLEQFKEKFDDILPLSFYCKQKEGHQSIIIKHYIEGKIDKYILVWLINKGFVSLTDDDRAQIPYIVENYRKYVEVVDNFPEFMERVFVTLNRRYENGKKDKQEGLADNTTTVGHDVI